MTKETPSINQFITVLIEAAKENDWEKVDNELMPQLEGFDGNQMARGLLRHVKDENPDVRDVVATALSPLEISDEETKKETIEAMINMASTDKERFPAGRAAVFLLRHKQDEGYAEEIEAALASFKTTAERKRWVQDFRENIPELEEIL